MQGVQVAGVPTIARLSMLLLAVCGTVVSCMGQQGIPEASSPDKPYTLHVYQDLIEVPTLVLNTLHGSYRGLGSGDFLVRLDSGPAFHPVHMRTEGDDPISLAVLMEDSARQSTDLSRSLEAAVSHLPADFPGVRDRVSVFAFDCSLMRSGFRSPGSVLLLASAMGALLKRPELHVSQGSDRCEKRVGLWDAIGEVAREMQDAPGRKVLLVLSDGRDYGSRNSWEVVRRYATAESITIFALRPPLQPVEFALSGIHSFGQVVIDYEEKLGMLCSGTGGVSLVTSPQMLESMLRRVIDLLRDRYILEFARPVNESAGVHDIAVSVRDRTALVRVSGLAVPMQEELLRKDPSTIPADTTKSPVLGTRRVLTEQKEVPK